MDYSLIPSFFVRNTPRWDVIMTAGPAGLFWAYLCLHWAGWLKQHRSWRTGYTRKVFHFLIFTSVAVIQAAWGTSAVCLFGGMTSLVIFYALVRGNGHPLYEAMAREKDAPHRTYYILAPYFATLLGGLVSNILFGPLAVAGYLVTGLGDAIGEPVGTRFGKHPYKVPAFRGVPSTRTLEGSAGVLVACVIALALAVAISDGLVWSTTLLALLPALAIACTLLEAVSPHGWDNATMQIVPSFLAAVLLT